METVKLHPCHQVAPQLCYQRSQFHLVIRFMDVFISRNVFEMPVCFNCMRGKSCVQWNVVLWDLCSTRSYWSSGPIQSRGIQWRRLSSRPQMKTTSRLSIYNCNRHKTKTSCTAGLLHDKTWHVLWILLLCSYYAYWCLCVTNKKAVTVVYMLHYNFHNSVNKYY